MGWAVEVVVGVEDEFDGFGLVRFESVKERAPLECPLNRTPLESPLDRAECSRWAQGPFEKLDVPVHGSLKVV